MELSKIIRISVFYKKKIFKFNSIVLKWAIRFAISFNF